MALVDEKTAEDFYAYLRRLYGDSYGSNHEDSVFQRQLRAWSTLLATGRSEIDRAFRQAFPDLSDAMLEEWERAFGLPNDTVRSLVERQARLAAHERTQRGATRENLQGSLDAGGVAAYFVANRRADVLYAGSEDEAVFQTTLQLSNEDFFDPAVREAVETLYGHALPARHVGALDALGPGHSTCVEVGAAWGSASHFVGRDAIGRQTTVMREERRARARVRSFGPGSRLDAESLNAIQETILGSALTAQSGLSDYGLVEAGLLTRWFGLDLTVAGSPFTVDNSLDWRDRMLWMQWIESTTQELAPGGAEDDQYGGSPGNGPKQLYLYTGAGSGASPNYRGFSAAASPRFEVYATVGGDLMIACSGSDRNIAGVLWATEPLGKS